MKKVIAALVAALALPSMASADLSIEWDWKKSHNRCNGSGESPELRVSGIPDGTSALRFEMTDLDNGKDHKGGRVDHSGGTSAVVAEGALNSSGYFGPCPPDMVWGHIYEISVKAESADGIVLAEGSKKQDFNNKTAK